jgi:hypothetical protein
MVVILCPCFFFASVGGAAAYKRVAPTPINRKHRCCSSAAHSFIIIIMSDDYIPTAAEETRTREAYALYVVQIDALDAQYLEDDTFYVRSENPYANFQDPVRAEREVVAKAKREAAAAKALLMGETDHGSDEERVAQTNRKDARIKLAEAQRLLQGVNKDAAAAPVEQTPEERQLEEYRHKANALPAHKKRAAAPAAAAPAAAAAASGAPKKGRSAPAAALGAPKKGHSAPALGGRGDGGGGEGKEDRLSKGGKGPGGIKALEEESQNSRSNK